ncbi:HAMP domain-containing sensor histidine kinase [Ferrovibrio sp. MS7]|uniref:sensor histidine kinase n=1 Tax=Ferrovibrio plantarum TaxID=3119164 RepID=UPI0031366617
MLDTRTILFVTSLLAAAASLSWVMIWLAHPRLPGLRPWTGGIVLIAAGLVLVALRGMISDWLSVVLANTLVILGQSFTIFAIADLLRQPRPRLLLYGLSLLTLLLWSFLWITRPDDIGIRIVFYALFAGVQFLCVAWLILVDTSFGWRARGPVLVLAVLHAIALAIRGVYGALTPDGTSYLIGNFFNVFWSFEHTIALFVYSVVFAMLFGIRLTRDQQNQNQALTEIIATQRMLQVQLRGALSREASMRREQQQFVTRMGQELDRPLRAIAGHAEALRAAPAEFRERIMPRLDAIGGANARLKLLIRTFLLERRIRSGIAEMRHDAVDLKVLLHDLLRDHSRPGGRPNAEQRLRFAAPELPVMAHGDAAMLAIVFGNLVDNALKYSAADAAVDVRLHRERDEAVVTVQDRGIGIPASDLAAIGQRFYRAGNAAKVQGTGLGLFSAARLIQFHGGRFLVSSEPDKGTQVTVHLPLQQGA